MYAFFSRDTSFESVLIVSIDTNASLNEKSPRESVVISTTFFIKIIIQSDINSFNMGACCETNLRKDHTLLSFAAEPRAPRVEFSFQDVVPIKHHHYVKEYEYEKHLPSIKETISKVALP